MKKIISLSKVFIKDYYENLYIVNNKKINKKSMFFWLIIILLIAEGYLSKQIIDYFDSIGYPEIFLNLFFPILGIIMMFQIILLSTNIFYFSKDLEFVLPLPIRPIELLMSKFNTLISIVYASEIIIGLLPIIMYGMLTQANLLYYFWIILIFLLFPILYALIISTIILFIMKLSKFIKNKNVFQTIITVILMIVVWAIEIIALNNITNLGIQEESEIEEQIINVNERFENANNYFLVINPIINILNNPMSFGAILELIKIIGINLIGLFIFIIFGKILYLNNILKNNIKIISNKNKKININKNIKNKKIGKIYVEKEFKMLFRNASFFIQCVFPVIIILITFLILIIAILPNIDNLLQNEDFREILEGFEFNSEIILIILGALQILFTMSNISLTAISRDGKNAIFIKQIPVELYKQFIYKNMPQVIINLIITIIILIGIYCLFPSIGIKNIILLFLIANLINLINSYLMLIVDLLRPRLNWDSEIAVVKKSDNKIFQYILMLIIILFLMYLSNIFEDIDINICLIGQIIIFGIIFIIIDRLVKKYQNKLFKKIY